MFWHIPPARQDQGNHPLEIPTQWGGGGHRHWLAPWESAPSITTPILRQSPGEGPGPRGKPSHGGLSRAMTGSQRLAEHFSALRLCSAGTESFLSCPQAMKWNRCWAGLWSGLYYSFCKPDSLLEPHKGRFSRTRLSIKLGFPKERVPSDPTSQLGITGKCQPANKALKDSKIIFTYSFNSFIHSFVVSNNEQTCFEHLLHICLALWTKTEYDRGFLL